MTIAKTNPENGRISTPLFQIFGFDHEKCSNCLRKQKVKNEAKEVKERLLEEVLEHLKHGSYTERCEFNRFTGFVPVLNGLLNLTSLELKPFDPNVIYTYKLDVRFDAEAKCPRWLVFLD